MSGKLSKILEALVAEELEENPVLATALGADGYDDRLPDVSASGFERRDAAASRRIAELEAIGDDGLTITERADRDLAVAMLSGRTAMADWQAWRRNPDVYLDPTLNGVFALFLHRLHPDADLARSAAARLRALPETLEEGRRNLDPSVASPELIARAIRACRAAVRYARELIALEVGENDGRADLADAGETAAQAIERFADFLEDLEPRARGTHAIGEERYSTLLRRRELLNLDAAMLHGVGEQQWESLAREMSELCKNAGLDADGDWRSVVEQLNDDHPSTPEEMLSEYRSWTGRAREFLVEHRLVSFVDGEECLVEPSPHFQRPVLAVASYNSPPALRPSITGHFFVPYPPDGTPPEELRERLRSNSHHEIPTVSAHEAYPGHHWHLITMRASGRPLRHIFRSAYFVEGWGLYAERLMREHGFFQDPRQELMHLKDRVFRAARIVVDTSLHAGDMTPEQAARHMMDKVGLPEPTAKAEVARYCAWPTQASAYLTGSLAIERIRERWLSEAGGDLRGFHDAIASLGAMPVTLHERSLFDS